jgi:hypothetical protein
MPIPSLFRCYVASLLLGLLLAAVPARAAEGEPPPSEPAPGARPEVVLDLDAYYTSLDVHLPLTHTPIPDLGQEDEVSVYRRLLLNSFAPRFVILEAAIYPMPDIGVYLKKNTPSFYDSAAIDGFNIVESLTAGFQEPYSFSVFFGDVVNFVKEGEARKGTNKGYMGYMLSYSREHIKNNRLIDDPSWEAEWKLKGERNFTDDKLSWSFRVGAKIHENPDIANVAYLGLRRSDLDFNSPVLSWLKNSSFEFRWDFSLNDGNIVRQEYIVGKKYPFKSPHVALKLDFGLVWQSFLNYAGPLRDVDHHSYTFVVRPNLQF